MSPAERVKIFKNQIIVREVAFHAERKILHYTHNTKYNRRANAGTKAQLINIISEEISAESLNIPGAGRLKTLGIGRHPEYDQAVLADTETRSGMEGTGETMKFHGIKQRHQYVLNLENGTPKMNGVNTCRDSAEKWEHRNVIQRMH